MSFGSCINLKAKRDATFSLDKKYRYWLQRRNTHGHGWVVFCLLNPSIAGAERADPTTRRLSDFSVQWGMEGFIIVNLFAAVATDPDDMMEMDNPVGPLNQGALIYALEVARSGRLVVGWGRHAMGRLRGPQVMGLIREKGITPWCFGTTKERQPKHPLYLASETELEVYG